MFTVTINAPREDAPRLLRQLADTIECDPQWTEGQISTTDGHVLGRWAYHTNWPELARDLLEGRTEKHLPPYLRPEESSEVPRDDGQPADRG